MQTNYEQRIKDLELEISVTYPKTIAQETALNQLRNKLALLKRFQMTDEIGLIKHPTKVKNKAPIPERRIYSRNVSPHSHDSLFIAPPFGNLGVLILNVKEECPQVGDFIEFLEYKKVVVSGVIVAIEKPGSCIRPDIKRDGSHKWKIHWVPWDQYAVKSYLNRKQKETKSSA